MRIVVDPCYCVFCKVRVGHQCGASVLDRDMVQDQQYLNHFDGDGGANLRSG